ncbi:hypothetical protein C7M84_008846 [Penaeus vannamei]|uniref:CHK kinase-like domain-containing protein n=1 Tax=Penaeus vannamei TaxID=6689 RepID=A0A423T8F0_PENVA|nr:hypothetical protein C7M84_008846 [Penaeus vannamei]
MVDEAERIKSCHALITEQAVTEALKADQGAEAQLASWQIEDHQQGRQPQRDGDERATRLRPERGRRTPLKRNPGHDREVFEEVTRKLFLKEAEFYSNLLPQLNAVLEEAGMKPLAMPRCFYSAVERKKELVLLEDLRPRGFKMFDRRKGLDVAHVSLVLEELARLHAASLLLEKKEPQYFRGTCLNRGWAHLFEGAVDLGFVLGQHIDSAKAMLDKIGGYESAATWAESLKPKLQDIFEKQMEPTKYHVLCHGDAWNNNLLFSYRADGSPEAVMFVDLQICRRVSFATDINYLLYTSLTGDVRKPNLDALLETYRGQFNAVMETRGGSEGRLSEGEVLQEFRQKNVIGAIFTRMLISVILLEPQDVEELSDLKDKEIDECFLELRKEALDLVDSNPFMRPRFLAVVEELVETGLVPA